MSIPPGAITRLVNPPTTSYTLPSGITPSSFLPTQIPGCRLWLDGADPNANGVLPANGSTLSTWVDKSGAANNMLLTSGTVTYNLTSKVVNFPNGGNGVMTSANSTTFTVNQSVVFVVCEVIAIPLPPSNIGYVFACPNINPSGTLGDYSIRFGTTTTLYSLNSNDIGFGSAYYVNGTLGVPSGGTITIPARPNIIYGLFNRTGTSTFTLSSLFSTRYFIGNIQEVLFYTGPITTAQRQEVEGYLAWKWGLQGNLDPSNPYVTQRPRPNPSLTNVPYVSTILGSSLTASFRQASFNPRNIAGIALWLDAADQSTIIYSTGKNISAWNDKSGLANNALQGSAVNQPSYATDGIYPAILMNSAGPHYLNGGPLLTSTSYSWFIIYRTTTPTTQQYIFIDYKQAGNQVFVQAYIGTDGKINPSVFYGTLPSATFKSASYTPAANKDILEILDSPTNTTNNFYTNGTVQTTTFQNNGAANISTDAYGYLLGGIKNPNFQAGSNFNGYIYEVIVYLNQLTTSQRQQVEGYLAWKWGAQANLPPTHPFKLFPPPP